MLSAMLSCQLEYRPTLLVHPKSLDLLPILSKPLNEQIAIAAIIRRGGYVPRKIEI